MATIAVYGAGSWGTALAVLLAKAGHKVFLVGRDQDQILNMARERENTHYLPGVVLPESLVPTTAPQPGADMVVLSVPSHAVRTTAQSIRPYLTPGTIVVNTAKGLEEHTHLRLSQVLAEELPNNRIAVLSGPSHAEEVGREMPTAVVISAGDLATAEEAQDIFMTPNFRVYTNTDTVGVELGGALKNIIALCTGIAEGLGFGDNTKAALMTRGLAEIGRLGSALGGNLMTFAGLSGVGDLIVTCTSGHSRNRRAGLALGQGKPLHQVLEEVGMVVEGVRNTKVAYELASSLCISMPITEQAYKVLFEGADAQKAVSDLMLRDKGHESEAVVMMTNGYFQ